MLQHQVLEERQVGLSKLDVMDGETMKLYYSILNAKRRQDVHNRQRKLLSSPADLKTCKSRPKTPFYEMRESPINREKTTSVSVKYVYLSQSKPHPIEPLKAWKGYNGNLYFQPININRYSNLDKLSHNNAPSLPSTSRSLTKPHSRHDILSRMETALYHPEVKLEKSMLRSRLSMSPSVIDQSANQEPYGTLILGPLPAKPPKSVKMSQICKGSMVHHLRTNESRQTAAYRYTLHGFRQEHFDHNQSESSNQRRTNQNLTNFKWAELWCIVQ